MNTTKSSVVRSASCLVIKIGSSLVTNDGKGLDRVALLAWAEQIAKLKQLGKQVVMVSSGAIAEGCQRLGWLSRPQAIHELQAAAAVGQMGLVEAYEAVFARYFIQTAQVLLTHEDLSDRTRYLNARSTLSKLLSLNVVPIINENDTVVTDEIRFGDNDTLGALVTNLIEADALVILTDQRGLFTADPRLDSSATLINEALAGDLSLEKMAGGAGSKIGTGGMYTKIIAAKRAARSGASTVIACGREENVLCRLAAGEQIGTQLLASKSRIAARKQWIADQLKLSGQLILDAGATFAVREKHTSLLPVGVIAIEGEFLRGDAVACVDESGNEVARGLVNYSSAESRRIVQHSTCEIEQCLGYIVEPELIHRNNMVVL